jgi:hypothetical protein
MLKFEETQGWKRIFKNIASRQIPIVKKEDVSKDWCPSWRRGLLKPREN